MIYTYAIVRKPGKSYLDAISSTDQNKNIDLEKALFQHQKYTQTLEKIGLEIINLPVEEKYPDGCFVQDPFVIFNNVALQTVLGADSRKGEGDKMFDVIKKFKKIKKMKNPATMDGGDVLITPKKIFIGNSSRTNLEGIEAFKRVFNIGEISGVCIVSVEKCLHLMTGVTYIGKNTLLLSSHINERYFKDFNKIHVPDEEIYVANCLSFDNLVIVPKGYPYVVKQIKKLGFEVIELEMSEFKKADGGLTCLSQLF